MSNSTKVKVVPENTIIAYVIPGVKKDVSNIIRPCKPSREWVDNTPGQYAYRCIPLSAANTMGWEILNPVDAEIRWTGLDNGDEIQVKSERDPYPLELLNDMKIELRDMHEDPAFVKKVKGWEKQRQVDYQNQQQLEQEWAEQGRKPRMKDMWNSQYARGPGSDDASVEYRTVFKCADAVDRRKQTDG